MNIDRLAQKCVNPAIEDFYRDYQQDLVRKPEYFIDPPDLVRRTVGIRLLVPKGEAKKLYVLQARLMQRVMALWDIQAGRNP